MEFKESTSHVLKFKEPDLHVLHALNHIYQHEETSAFLTWLMESLEDVRKMNDDQLNPTLLRMGQGGAQLLSGLLEHLETASDRLNARRQP